MFATRENPSSRREQLCHKTASVLPGHGPREHGPRESRRHSCTARNRPQKLCFANACPRVTVVRLRGFLQPILAAWHPRSFTRRKLRPRW